MYFASDSTGSYAPEPLTIEPVAHLRRRLTLLTLEYHRHMHCLDDLSYKQLRRIENIEAFFGHVFETLKDDEFSKIHVQYRLFTKIKTRYRLPHFVCPL